MNQNTYAVIKNDDMEVINTIVAGDDFTLKGYFLIPISDIEQCEVGMIYDKSNNVFRVK